MESSQKFFPVAAILLLLVVATEVAPTFAAECKTASNKFSGLCVLDSTCSNTCVTEGFTGDDCEGLRRRCMCHQTF